MMLGLVLFGISDLSQVLRSDNILTSSLGITTFSLMEIQNSGSVFHNSKGTMFSMYLKLRSYRDNGKEFQI